jgi:hypothetical protein
MDSDPDPEPDQDQDAGFGSGLNESGSETLFKRRKKEKK